MRLGMVDLAAQRRVLEPSLSRAIAAVLDHQQFVLGPEVAALEAALVEATGAADVVTCANGTDALVLALRALGTGPGDVVIVPAFTFAATAEAVALTGARPIFADIRRDTYGIDVAAIVAHLDEVDADAVVGVVAVDLFGQPADHDELAALSRQHGWWIVTDAAQSLGSAHCGRRAGTLGDLVATSFFPSKPLGCYGDGGAVLCPTPERSELLRSLRNHGSGADRYENLRVGTNSRLDTIQAAILLQKLRVFETELASRREVAGRYTAAFEGTQVVPPVVAPGRESAWAQYTVRLPHRQVVTDALDAAEIAWAVHYGRCLVDQEAFAGSSTLGDLPEARRAPREVLSLPMHPYLDVHAQERVIEVILAAMGGADG